MWIVSGPFDGVQEGAKEKLLKPGNTYTIGRAKAGQSLVGRINIDSKSISHEHVDLIIGSYEIDDVSDVQAKPTVQLVVRREKDIWVNTPTQRVGKGVIHNVESGEEIGLTNKISAYVLWKPVVAVNADPRIKKDRMREVAVESAKLGITVSKSWMDNATHFITQSINMSRRPLHSLMLGISMVDVKWLEELFRRGNTLSVEAGPDEHGVVALESHFVLPDEKEFRPQLLRSEDEDEDVTGWPVELWDSDPRRKSMWMGLQFHFFCDDTPPTEWTDQAQLGGATFKSHNFNPELAGDNITTLEEANTLFQNIRLSAARLGQVTGMKSPVVIVIKPSEIVSVLGKAIWKLYQEGMKNNGFKYVTPKDVTQAVLQMDVTSIDCGLNMPESPAPGPRKLKKNTTTLSSLPDFVPPSHTGEISVSGPMSIVTPSSSGAQEPSEAPGPISEVPRPRLLKRRLPSPSRDPSAIPAPPVLEHPAPTSVEVTEGPIKEESTVGLVRRPLKRRVKTTTIAEVLGLDESNASIDPASLPTVQPSRSSSKSAAMEVDTAELPPAPAQTHGPAPRANRLKRRADVLAERTAAPAIPEEIEPREEPALKRYRQLFEGTQRAASTVLHPAFDDEGSTILGPTPATAETTRKRKSADRDDQSDVEMVEPTRLKRRLVENKTNEQVGQSGGGPDVEPNLEPQSQLDAKTQSRQPGVPHRRGSGQRGAVPGSPDKDTTLLNALAQKEKEKEKEQEAAATTSKTKNGKSAAAIDKEFANMRIAQASEEKEEASRRRAEEMRVWEECERDINIRGNFMVIELVDLVRRNRGPAVRSVNPAWEGKPDFKKFKKKSTGPRGPRVHVFANDEERLDYGLGDNYWEQNPAMSETQTHTGDMSRAKIRTVKDDDSDTPIPQTTRANRGRSAAPPTTTAATSSRVEPKPKPKPKARRIAVEDSDESDGDELSRLKISSASVVGSKRRPIPSSTRKTNLADFGMRDDDSVSEGDSRGRSNGVRPDEDTFDMSDRAGDEEAVSNMVAQESARATPTPVLNHMSSLGSVSLGVSKPTALGVVTAKRTKAPPKKVVIADSDSDGGGFKGFGAKRKKRGAAAQSS